MLMYPVENKWLLSKIAGESMIHLVVFLAEDALSEVSPPVYSQVTLKILSSNIK